MNKLYIFDIETLAGCYLIGIKEEGKDNWYWFEISAYRNDLYSFMKFVEENDADYWVGFNNIFFDMQVIQFIIDNYDKWYDLKNQDIIDKIYSFSQEIITNQNYDILPPYRENYFSLAQLDLFKILGFDNEAKRTSLKWVEFMTDSEVDEMPIHHSQKNFTQEEVKMVTDYCKNDILATETLYNYVRGNCENPEYKGKDKIQERLDVIEEFKLPARAINFSNVRLGETINLQGYMKEAGIKNMSALYAKKKQRKYRKFTFGDCIPKHVEFKTEQLKKIKEEISAEQVNLNKKQEFPFTFDNLTYVIAKGGIHSENTACILETTENHIILEFDCSSQYPSSIVRRRLYPSHLGKEWLINYEKLIKTRLEAKEKGKQVKKYKGISETLKESINGGGFGKTNEPTSVQYDPFVQFQCTIGNQFEILMLIESLTLEGISILSANTDGALCKIPREKEKDFYKICQEWERIVGITDIGNLEYTPYKKFIMLNVNSYIAVKEDDSLKQKKDFLTDFLLEKNKSMRVVRIALRDYFIKGIPVEQTITTHKNIFDFCKAKKASSNFYYQGVDKSTGKVNKYNKLIRYYISTEGEKLYKIKKENVDTKAPEIAECEAKIPCQVLFNTPWFPERFEDYKINYNYYIQEANKIIFLLNPEEKRKHQDKVKHQLSLF